MSRKARIWTVVAVSVGLALLASREWLVASVVSHQQTVVERILIHFVAAPMLAALAAWAVFALRKRSRRA